MKPLQIALKSVVKGLKVVTREVEKIEKLLNILDAAQTGGKNKSKAAGAKKAAAKRNAPRKSAPVEDRVTDVDAVLAVIERSPQGATTAQIKAKTGFSDKKVWNNVNRLKRQGKVKSEKRGLYRKS
ncbi:MAG: hypothetical protein ABII06_22240 [Pseudomonadota bacterium]